MMEPTVDASAGGSVAGSANASAGGSDQQSRPHFDATPLALHETMELHELLNFKTLSAAKAKAMDGLLTDRDLKALVQEDMQHSLFAIERLEEFLRPAAQRRRETN